MNMQVFSFFSTHLSFDFLFLLQPVSVLLKLHFYTLKNKLSYMWVLSNNYVLALTEYLGYNYWQNMNPYLFSDEFQNQFLVK